MDQTGLTPFCFFFGVYLVDSYFDEGRKLCVLFAFYDSIIVWGSVSNGATLWIGH